METAQGKYKNKKKKIMWGKDLRDDNQQEKEPKYQTTNGVFRQSFHII